MQKMKFSVLQKKRIEKNSIDRNQSNERIEKARNSNVVPFRKRKQIERENYSQLSTVTFKSFLFHVSFLIVGRHNWLIMLMFSCYLITKGNHISCLHILKWTFD